VLQNEFSALLFHFSVLKKCFSLPLSGFVVLQNGLSQMQVVLLVSGLDPKQRLLIRYAAKGAFQICNVAVRRKNENILTSKRPFQHKKSEKSKNIRCFTLIETLQSCSTTTNLPKNHALFSPKSDSLASVFEDAVLPQT
jgi:hypothetical protein